MDASAIEIVKTILGVLPALLDGAIKLDHRFSDDKTTADKLKDVTEILADLAEVFEGVGTDSK